MNSIYSYVLVILVSFIIGLFLRNKIEQYKTNKLIKELEEFFGHPLPKFKKSKTRIQWSKVLKMLRKEPTTQKLAHWKELVRKQIK